MAQQKNKDRGLPRTDKRSAPSTRSSKLDENKQSKHEYDPGGMAGQKAGIVEKLQQDASEPDGKIEKANDITVQGSTKGKPDSKKP